MKNIVVVGNGFAGMWAALVARHEARKHPADINITLVAPDCALTVRPRLYEVFGEEMRADLTSLFATMGVNFQSGHVEEIDAGKRRLGLSNGKGTSEIAYDKLVLAAGSVQRPLGVPGEAEYAHSIDTFAQARAFDEHLARTLSAPATVASMTFVVVGGGFTGIEIAAEMRTRIKVHAGEAAAKQARVILIERADVIGHELGENPRPVIEEALRVAGVEYRVGAQVTHLDKNAIQLANGERIATQTVVVTTGLIASPLARMLGAETDRAGRLVVDDYLQVKGIADVFAAGDIAHAKTDDDHTALMSCQHAVPMGKFAGFNALHALSGTPLRMYRQPGYVTCLDLGSYGAVLTMGWERKVEQAGADVKSLKRMINTQWIYPPTGDLEAVMKATDIDAPWPPTT